MTKNAQLSCPACLTKKVTKIRRKMTSWRIKNAKGRIEGAKCSREFLANKDGRSLELEPQLIATILFDILCRTLQNNVEHIIYSLVVKLFTVGWNYGLCQFWSCLVVRSSMITSCFIQKGTPLLHGRQLSIASACELRLSAARVAVLLTQRGPLEDKTLGKSLPLFFREIQHGEAQHLELWKRSVGKPAVDAYVGSWDP